MLSTLLTRRFFGSSTSRMTSLSPQQHIPLANKAIDFLSRSTDPFHAVHHSVAQLKQAGFVGLSASEPLTGKIEGGGKYYYIVEHSTLVAFTVGSKYQSGSSFGFHMIGKTKYKRALMLQNSCRIVTIRLTTAHTDALLPNNS